MCIYIYMYVYIYILTILWQSCKLFETTKLEPSPWFHCCFSIFCGKNPSNFWQNPNVLWSIGGYIPTMGLDLVYVFIYIYIYTMWLRRKKKTRNPSEPQNLVVIFHHFPPWDPSNCNLGTQHLGTQIGWVNFFEWEIQGTW